MGTVVVGMSGGVDSSVCALLLKEQGYRVIGLFMNNWEESDGEGKCTAAKEYEDVVKVCEQLKIPYYGVNFAKEYREKVFSQFLADLERGVTPNPDILCNREIKFKVLLQRALSLDADFLATGHYCRKGKSSGKVALLRGSDPNKDQSYFLHAISGHALDKALFPIGGMLKSEVRAIATANNLPTATKRDSTGICFIGKRPFKQFVSQYLPYSSGIIETVEGKVIGKHDGVAFYTIGQRKGLGIGGSGEPWFVVAKDLARNALIVAQGENHPALFTHELFATQLTWISGKEPAMPFRCSAKVRYRQADQKCTVTAIDGSGVRVNFDAPQRAVTPQQSVVFYDGELCLGGGVIAATRNDI